MRCWLAEVVDVGKMSVLVVFVIMVVLIFIILVTVLMVIVFPWQRRVPRRHVLHRRR